MRLKFYNSQITEFFYLFVMIFYLFSRYVSFTSNENLRSVILTLANLLIIIFVFIFTIFEIIKNKKITIKKLLIFTFFFIELIISIVSSSFQFDYILLLFLSLSYIFPNKDSNLVKSIFIVKIIFLALVLILGVLGIFGDIQNVKGTYLVAHSYGFIHPNSLGAFFLSIVIDIAILFKRNLKTVLLLFIIISLQYSITFSRTSSLIAFIILLIFLVKPYLINKFYPTSYKLISIIFIWGISILLPLVYSSTNHFLNKLSILFSNRIYLGNYYINYYGFSLFPQSIQRIKYSRFWDYLEYYNDNYYLDFVLKNGILISLLVGILILLILKDVKFSLFNGVLLCFCFVFLFLENYSINVFLLTPFIFNIISENYVERGKE